MEQGNLGQGVPHTHVIKDTACSRRVLSDAHTHPTSDPELTRAHTPADPAALWSPDGGAGWGETAQRPVARIHPPLA